MAKKKQDKISIADINDKSLKMIAARDALSKSYGTDILIRGNESVIQEVDFITTQSILIDWALGGGWPKGRIVEILGEYSSGKTTLCLHSIAEVLNQGGIGVFVDMEHALDPEYARNLGVDTKSDNFYLSQPAYGEQALEVVDAMVLAGADIIVVDSVASLVPKAELEGTMEDMQVGLQARLMSKALRKITGSVAKTHSIVIFTNQIREGIGRNGPIKTSPGGRALRFYASIRVEMKHVERLQHSKDGFPYGGRHEVKVVKNKVAPPYRSALVDIIYGKGLVPYGVLLDVASEHDIVNKSGSWYSYGDIRLGQGRDNSATFLSENPELLKEIDAAAREVLFPSAVTNEEVDE